MANSYPASGQVILDDLKVCTSARLQPHFVSYGEHMFMNLESAHNNSYLPVVTFSRAGCTLGAIGLERASNSDSVGSYTESEMIIGTRANTPTSIQTNGVRRINIASGGNVGIGTTSPTSPLHLRDSTNGFVGLRIEGSGTYSGSDFTIFASALSPSSADDFLGFYNNSTTDGATEGYKLRLFKSGVANFVGNIGIGTTAPDSRLHICNAVAGGTNNYSLIIQNACTVADARAGIAFSNNGQTPSAGGLSGASIQTSNNGIDGTGNLIFGTLLSGANTERMRISHNGNIGMGTSSPSYRLHVCRTANAEWLSSFENTDGTESVSTYISHGAGYGIAIDSSENDAKYIFKAMAGTGGGGGKGSVPVIFAQHNGLVGMGTSSPASLLHLAGGGTGTRGALRISEIGLTNYWELGRDNGVSGDFTINSNANERMRVTTTGCVGIGTASPSYRLHVNGTFYAAGSSIEYKEGISQYDTDSCLFMCLKPKTYQYKDEWKHLGKDLKSGIQIGLIAEEVAEIMPELAVLVNEEENKVVRNVDYEKLSIILLSEVQKLRKEVDNIKNNK